MTLAPSKTTLVALGLVCMPMVAAGVYGVFFIAGAAFWGFVLFIIGLVSWAYVGTIRVVLSGEQISFRRFWRTEWSCLRANAQVTDGMGGAPASIPALIITNQSNRTTHSILKTQFARSDISKIRDFLCSAK